MQLSKKISIVAILFLSLMAFHASAQVPKDIIKSFDTGDSKLLSGFFNQDVELVVLDNDNVYSKAQAEQIVASFFKSFPPIEKSAFTVIHNSEKEDPKFVIGKLQTTKGNFRVNFLLKKTGAKEYIHQLRIEKQ
ncbi:DUF4783 domain-containing protein [Maribellus sp. YY47]|uniref:DUF4783 domain-containing protein n=1 Tax=Maribellus sp. YY47 TaxID=2929486 RepID=UPI0020013AE8|nr:DUF4783 domain-containing protein [Maribellus sp. YY47]MCK3683927.1 DUF4783 domain-containing protein [Maribellus sp. YY47]